MIFNTWESRKEFLITFQQALHSEFGEDGYNVFIFGSFLREDYKPLESDLDLAVFCPDKRKSIFIQGYIEDYLNAREIPFDLIEIHLWQKGEFIDISPLMLNVGMTDYRPEDLNIYLRMLRRDYVFYREETDYIRNFKKLNNIL